MKWRLWKAKLPNEPAASWTLANEKGQCVYAEEISLLVPSRTEQSSGDCFGATHRIVAEGRLWMGKKSEGVAKRPVYRLLRILPEEL